ncbi:MAG: hypothetical protein ACYC0F_05175 [Rhodanobacter sp.]
MTARKPKPRTATARSLARNRRASKVLAPVALDDDHTRMLADILADTGETAAAWVRRMIREHARDDS